MSIKVYNTEQENFWAGEFGDQYITRNADQKMVSANIALFSKIFSKTHAVTSVLELGANIGLNLKAIRTLIPHVQLAAVEINKLAAETLARDLTIKVHVESLLDFKPTVQSNFVLTKGVLIHLSPERIMDAYDTLYRSSNKYICLVEYYNPTPVEVSYRGNKDKLFKRDFAGEMLDQFNNLKLVDYGFVYHRDFFGDDDLTWFLLEKR